MATPHLQLLGQLRSGQPRVIQLALLGLKGSQGLDPSTRKLLSRVFREQPTLRREVMAVIVTNPGPEFRSAVLRSAASADTELSILALKGLRQWPVPDRSLDRELRPTIMRLVRGQPALRAFLASVIWAERYEGGDRAWRSAATAWDQARSRAGRAGFDPEQLLSPQQLASLRRYARSSRSARSGRWR